MIIIPIERLLYGLAVAVILGGIFTEICLYWMRKYLGTFETYKQDLGNVKGLPAWFTGIIERIFFTIVIGFDISSSAIAMIGWLTLKMVTNWNRPQQSTDQLKNQIRIVNAFASLLAGIISMFSALIGGLIIKGVCISF